MTEPVFDWNFASLSLYSSAVRVNILEKRAGVPYVFQ